MSFRSLDQNTIDPPEVSSMQQAYVAWLYKDYKCKIVSSVFVFEGNGHKATGAEATTTSNIYRDVLRHNRVYLQDNITLNNQLFSRLITARVLTTNENELIKVQDKSYPSCVPIFVMEQHFFLFA